jgi:hypothetical protein
MEVFTVLDTGWRIVSTIGGIWILLTCGLGFVQYIAELIKSSCVCPHCKNKEYTR